MLGAQGALGLGAGRCYPVASIRYSHISALHAQLLYFTIGRHMSPQQKKKIPSRGVSGLRLTLFLGTTRVYNLIDISVYISRLCYDVSVRLSVHLSVTEVHWRIIANLGFKFRSQFTAHCGRGACGREGRDHRREEWRDHLALC